MPSACGVGLAAPRRKHVRGTATPPKHPILLFIELAVVGAVVTAVAYRVHHVSESPNVGDDDRAILPLDGPVHLAVQVEDPT